MSVCIKAMRGANYVDRVHLKKQVQVMRDTFLDGKFRQYAATIILATDSKVRRLNWFYGTGRTTTDVLSFPLRDKPRRKPRIPQSFENDTSSLSKTAPFLDPDTGQIIDRVDVPPPVLDNLGRIFIAVAYCNQVAKERGVEHNDYITLACVHGMGHLVGFDHRTEDEYKAMKNAEEAVLRAVVSEVGLLGSERTFPRSYLW